MNIHDLETDPNLLKDLNKPTDYWDMIGEPDLLARIISSPELLNKVPEHLHADLKTMHIAIQKHPELNSIIKEFASKMFFGIGFTIFEVAEMVVIPSRYFEGAQNTTPLSWAAILSALLLSMAGGVDAFHSRIQDYKYYQYLLNKIPQEA